MLFDKINNILLAVGWHSGRFIANQIMYITFHKLIELKFSLIHANVYLKMEYTDLVMMMMSSEE